MQTSNHFGYSTKVWLTSAFISPVLIGLFFCISDGGIHGLTIVPLMIGFGLLFSIPNWFLLTVSVWQINRLKLLNFEKKIFITFISIILTIALFLIIFQGEKEVIVFSIPYYIMLIVGIWYYELVPSIDTLEQIPISKKVKVLEDILDDENY